MNQIAKDKGVADHVQFFGVPCSPYYLTRDCNGNVSNPFRTLFHQEMLKRRVLIPWVAMALAHGTTEIEMALEAGAQSMEIYSRALNDGIEKYLEGRSIQNVFRKFNK